MKQILVLVLLFSSLMGNSQCGPGLNLQYQWEVQYPVNLSAMSIEPDQLGRPYIYVASNELGLRIYNVSGVPFLAATLDTNLLQMRVMNVIQYDSLLYISIGSHFLSSTDPPGMAIVDISDPVNPVVKDIWIHSINGTGCGIVKVDGDFAYVGAMKLGMAILNISDPNNIQFESILPLDINFPTVNPPNPGLFNVRGMEIRNDIAYVCYDGGGLRIINCVNKQIPVETGRFANPITYASGNQPRAYNNIILKDSIAYIAVDYCGLEVIDIGDTANINLIYHWNPHDCPAGLWWDAPLHTNELKYVPGCEKIFMSSGKSEMLVVDVTNPLVPDSCAMFGSITDTTATWGIGVYGDKIFLSYSYVPTWIPWILVPFYSTWSGVKMLTWDNGCANGVEVYGELSEELQLYPNPSNGNFSITCNVLKSEKSQVRIFDLTGKTIFTSFVQFDAVGKTDILWNPADNGIFFIELINGNKSWRKKLIIYGE